MNESLPASDHSHGQDHGHDDNRLTAYLCVTCGTQYPPSATPPEHCPICEDDRQYIPAKGQQWTTLDALRADHTNRFDEIEPGVTRIVTEPKFGIGQQAYLIETPNGNILWDLIALVDDATIAEIQRRGGVSAIAISHAHYYTTMVEWSRVLGDVPVLLHEANRAWVMRPDPAVQFWGDDTIEPLPGVIVIRTGGHFPGGMVLHWDNAGVGDGKGVLFSGDIVTIVADPRWCTFMYSYPNQIPLDPATVARMATQLATYRFDRVHDAFDRHMTTDGNARIQRSAERYIQHIQGNAGPTIA
jgi:glyoxylase-like metal-dependent hydrolase (beta-lactamase superfamily II)